MGETTWCVVRLALLVALATGASGCRGDEPPAMRGAPWP
jgi:hypothetical protein